MAVSRMLREAVVGGVLASALILAGPAATLAASPPFPFQGADGDQVDGPLIDWQGMQAAQRVTHTPDPDNGDSIFEGSKENNPAGWRLTTGSAPQKDNILDGWSVVDQPGGLTFLYLALRARHRRATPASRSISTATEGCGTTTAEAALRPYRAGARTTCS